MVCVIYHHYFFLPMLRSSSLPHPAAASPLPDLLSGACFLAALKKEDSLHHHIFLFSLALVGDVFLTKYYYE